MRHTSRLLVAFSALALAACAEAGTDPMASAARPSTYGSYDGGGWDGDRNAPERAVSYINPDIGAATANPDVDPKSSCFNPDQYDTQKLSDEGTTNRNVHNDACFFGRSSSWSGSYGDQTKVDGPASFESTGVGIISACPDPDNAGPKVAILSADRKRCFQSGYQEKGMAGDNEFHARLNNTQSTGGAGTQRVVWCYDPERNGCSDSRVKSTVFVNWVQ